VTGPERGQLPPPTRAALDELGRLLLAGQNTQSVLQKVVDLLQRVMPDGAAASVTLLRDRQATTAAHAGVLATHLDEAQYERGHGPCLDAALGGQIVEIVDGRTEDRWPDYIPVFLDSGALSALAAPVPAAHLAAGLNVYAPMAHAFTDGDRRAVVEFAAHAGVVLTNMDALQDARELADNLHAAMVFRSVIEQAKGILMERHKVTADQAFRLLSEASMHTHRKVRDLAEHLVITGELLPDTHRTGRTQPSAPGSRKRSPGPEVT
jgi:GAF domain-containing protein